LLNPRAEAREPSRLLIDADVQANAAQAGGCCQAADACADNG
jgi:hypothetical protein